MGSFSSSTFTENEALAVLNGINGFGIKRISQLIERFGSASATLRAPVEALASFPELHQATRVNLQSFSAEKFLKKDDEACRKFGARRVTFLDEEYPARLHTIPDKPVVLYVAGEFPKQLECGVAIVGSRRASLYGLGIAERFALELAELGVCIISGVARGIDTAAHNGALRAGGRTVGVLGCGLDVVYPPENGGLYQRIKENGCLISEFPFGTPPETFNFPRRNRIVSGLSLGVVVVEAGIKSGALVTAGLALGQGRDVFAVPGRIDSTVSDGPHALIKQGAKPVLCVADILEDLPLKAQQPVGRKEAPGACATDALSAEEKAVLGFLGDDDTSYETLEAATGFGPATLMSALLALEISGRIVHKPGQVYGRAVDRA